MSEKIKISEREILDYPNDAQLGAYVRNKFSTFKEYGLLGDSLDMGQIPDYDSYDKCVICGKKSPYKISTHIDQRIGYIEGVGQTCFSPKECEK